MPWLAVILTVTIATILVARQGWYSRSWLRPRPASLFRSTRWFSVQHQLQDWTDGPGMLGVSQPKPLVNPSPIENLATLSKTEKWIFNNHGVIFTFIHWLWSALFSLGCSRRTPGCPRRTLAIGSERLLKVLKVHTIKHRQWGSTLKSMDCKSKLRTVCTS